MKIVIPGGSGQVGAILGRAFVAEGHDVVVLSRRPNPAPWRVVAWDAQTQGDWVDEIDGADVVINLAGRSVNCRYTARNRREIVDSRVCSTRALGEAIARAAPPAARLASDRAPRRFTPTVMTPPTMKLPAFSAAANRTSPIPGGSASSVAKSWEQAANEAVMPHTRKVLLRSAMVMSPDRGGVFDVLLGLVRRGLGGRAAMAVSTFPGSMIRTSSRPFAG